MARPGWACTILASPAAGVTTTAIVVSATNEPLRVPGSDGCDHLEYDLLVTNGFVAPVALTSIKGVAPDGETLLRLDGDALAAATQTLLSMGPTAEIPASGMVAVVVDVAVLPDREADTLGHHVAIPPPLRGDGWLAGSGCCWASLHRAVRVPGGGEWTGKQETFTIDWIWLRDGKPFAGDGSQREQWFGFGAEVYAVGDGTVVAVQEERPEEVPLQPIENVHAPGDYGGNAISLEIAPGVFAFYAHLEPDSVTVEVGERVTAGQLLGLPGNTGNSTAPHLHFGLIDDPDPLVGESLPMAFDSWTLQGTIDPAVYEGASADGAPPALVPKGAPEPQAGTLQLYLDVADFG